MEKQKFIQILEEQLKPALGCTDPVGVAYGSACAKSYLTGEILSIEAWLSVNIIKNASAVCIPRTEGRCGIALALALGALGGRAQDGLEVLSQLTEEHLRQADAMIAQKKVSAHVADTEKTLYIRVKVCTEGGCAEVTIEDDYLHIASVTVDGQPVESDCEKQVAQDRSLQDGVASQPAEGMPKPDYSVLSIASILQFVKEAQEEDLERVAQAVEMNTAISQAGLMQGYGTAFGAALHGKISDGAVAGDWINNTIARTIAAVDARMAGADIPVMSNTGSGNQGLTCTLPVICVAQAWQKSRLETLRAVAVSCLMAIHIKEKLGVLSAVCGAVIAASGTACATVYLMGGAEAQMLSAMKTALGNVAGMMCDGAKAGCAMKVATCTHAGLLAALMAMEGRGIAATDGVVGESEQEMIDNFVRVSKEGMAKMDRVVLDIILNK